VINDRFCRAQGGVDALREGYWLIQRRRASRVDIPVRIWFGPPDDPETGEPLDRSPRWRILIGGVEIDEEPVRLGGITFEDLTSFWPACCSDPIDEREYAYRLERQAWASEYDPFDPYGSPGGYIDPMTATLPFGD
jgi:hypothetical protein